MTKKILSVVFVIFFIFGGTIIAELESRAEFRAAAFYPTSKLFREIYGNVGCDYQIQVSTKFLDYCEVWSNLDWFTKKGKSVGFHDPTRVNIFNCSLGLNFIYPFNCFTSLYVGAGPSVGGIWLKNHSHFEKDKESKHSVGGVFKVGMYYQIYDRYFIDLFVDYLYQRVKFHHHHVEIGGFKPGVGIGVLF